MRRSRKIAVHVLQEEIQRHDALRKPPIDARPFGVRNDAWDEVERKKPLGAATVAVNGERDALNQERKVGEFATLLELRGRHPGHAVKEFGVVRARLSGGGEHLVVKAAGFVPFEQTRIRHTNGARGHLAYCNNAVSAGLNEHFYGMHQCLSSAAGCRPRGMQRIDPRRPASDG
jgi:hypothetical protein